MIEPLRSRHSHPALVASLELLASECPSVDLISYTVRALLDSPARGELIATATAWGTKPKDLGATLARTAGGLDKLERRRAGWRKPCEALLNPPATLALLQLANVRLKRVSGLARKRRLQGVIRKLERAHQTEVARARLNNFLRLPPGPVDIDLSRWLGPLSRAAGTPDGEAA